MKFFLTAKHWQLFLLMFGSLFGFQIALMLSIFSGAMPLLLFLFPVVMFLWVLLFMGWFYTLGTGLYTKVPATVHMPIKRFKAFMWFAILYMLLIPCLVFLMYTAPFNGAVTPPFIMLMVIVPLHLFAMFCMFHSLYFCTKCLKAAELQRDVTFGDYAGEFMLLWFSPIGIWILQPRINKLFAEPPQQPV